MITLFTIISIWFAYSIICTSQTRLAEMPESKGFFCFLGLVSGSAVYTLLILFLTIKYLP